MYDAQIWTRATTSCGSGSIPSSPCCETDGPDRAKALFRAVRDYLTDANVIVEDATLNTPYRNTIPLEQQPAYPGNIEIEQRIENINRWNAMAMVLRGYDSGTGVGGHIGTYASGATMLEVGLKHFFRNKGPDYGGDLVSIQAHCAPGIYARALLEGRLSVEQLQNFRRELAAGRRPVVLPASTQHAGLLGLALRVDGPVDAELHLPGTLCQVPGKPRPETEERRQGLELHR